MVRSTSQRLGTILKPTVGEELFQNGKYSELGRHRRLAGGEGGLHPGIDVGELRIAVGILCTLAGLAVGL